MGYKTPNCSHFSVIPELSISRQRAKEDMKIQTPLFILVAICFFQQNSAYSKLVQFMFFPWKFETEDSKISFSLKAFSDESFNASNSENSNDSSRENSNASSSDSTDFHTVTYCVRFYMLTTVQQCLFRDELNDVELQITNIKEKFGFLKCFGFWHIFLFKEELLPFVAYRMCLTLQLSKDGQLSAVVRVGNNTILESEGLFHNKSFKDFQFDPKIKQFKLGNCNSKDKDDMKQMFSGIMTDVNVYTRPLFPHEVQKNNMDCQLGVTKKFVKENILNTMSMTKDEMTDLTKKGQMAVGKAIKLRFLKEEGPFCKSNQDSTSVESIIIKVEMLQSSARHICRQFRGNLMMPSRKSEFKTLENILMQEKAISNHSCSNGYWLSIVQGDEEGGKFTWKKAEDNPVKVNYLPWHSGEPNGKSKQKCVGYRDAGIEDLNCKHDKRCLVCMVPSMSYFQMRFDVSYFKSTTTPEHLYTFLPRIEKDNLYFDGFSGSSLEWKAAEYKWILSKLSPTGRKNNLIEFVQADVTDIPIGKRRWQFKSREKSLQLTFSAVRRLMTH